MITSDRRETKVVLLDNATVIARIDPEDAIELAEDMIRHADKILAHIQED